MTVRGSMSSVERRAVDPWSFVNPKLRARVRAEFRALIDSGLSPPCPFCGRLIRPGSPFDVDHKVPLRVAPELVADRSNLRPAHPSCNRRSGGIAGNKSAKRRPGGVVPGWVCEGCGDRRDARGDWLCRGCRAVVAGLA